MKQSATLKFVSSDFLFETVGTTTRTGDTVTLEFDLEGSPFTFSVANGSMTVMRKGEMNYCLDLIEGETSVLTVFTQYGSAQIKLFGKRISVKYGNVTQILVKLIIDKGDSEEEKLVRVTVTPKEE